MGLALNLPEKVLGQRTELAVQSGDLIELRIGGAVRDAGLLTVDPRATLSEVLSMAGGPTTRAQGAKVWVFRDGEIVTTILGGSTRIGDSPIRSGDRLFVAWASAIPDQRGIGRNPYVIGGVLGGAAAIAIAFSR
jgi:protein involved in polysaccharide export with SLBB domain